MWLPPRRDWTTRFGQTVSFDELADQLLAVPLGAGSCYGTHLPSALVHLLRADEQGPIMSARTRSRVEYKLREISELLDRNQPADGGWQLDWADPNDQRPRRVIDGLAVTGHHLDWIAFAPFELRPARSRIRKAIEYVCHVSAETPTPAIVISYAQFSHAARAVSLLSLSERDLPASPVAKLSAPGSAQAH